VNTRSFDRCEIETASGLDDTNVVVQLCGMQTAALRHDQLYHEVLGRILRSIADGDFPPGDLFPSERQLEQQFGVNRAVIRKAMLTLQQMRIVELPAEGGGRVLGHGPPQGAIAAGVGAAACNVLANSASAGDHLKDARLFFEAGMARMAAERADAADLSRLEAALLANRAALGTGLGFVTTDMAFHVAIAETARNPIYLAVSRAMVDWLVRFRIGMVSAPGAEMIGFSEHARIFEMIARHDPDGAAAAMGAHVTRMNRFYRRFEKPASETSVG
jgi:DNA-binding FadR family transcriptional regulator